MLYSLIIIKPVKGKKYSRPIKVCNGNLDDILISEKDKKD
jgi:hypothetical protein